MDTNYVLALSKFSECKKTLKSAYEIAKNLRNMSVDLITHHSKAVEKLGDLVKLKDSSRIRANTNPEVNRLEIAKGIFGDTKDDLLILLAETSSDANSGIMSKAQIEECTNNININVVNPLKKCLAYVKKIERYISETDTIHNIAIGKTPIPKKDKKNTMGNVASRTYHAEELERYKVLYDKRRNMILSELPQFVQVQDELLVSCFTCYFSIYRKAISQSESSRQRFKNILEDHGYTEELFKKHRNKQSNYIRILRDSIQVGINLRLDTPGSETKVGDPDGTTNSFIEESKYDTDFSESVSSSYESKSSGKQSKTRREPHSEIPPTPESTSALHKERNNHEKTFVRALYDYKSDIDGDLCFKQGQIIEVLEKTDNPNSWWKGKVGDSVGIFPANYVSLG